MEPNLNLSKPETAQPSGPDSVSRSEHILYVCTSCNFTKTSLERQSNRGGKRLYEALIAKAEQYGSFPVAIQPVECLCVCVNSCAAALTAPGKFTFTFGWLDPDRHVDDLLKCARIYAASKDGFIGYDDRPGDAKRLVSRVPPSREANRSPTSNIAEPKTRRSQDLKGLSSNSLVHRSTALHQLLEVRVTAIRLAAVNTNIYEFESVDGEPFPPAEPGCHIDLHLPNGLVRQYSLLNNGPQLKRYLIGVKRDMRSRGGSLFLHDHLRVGQVLPISLPRNNFPLDDVAERHAFFAGGIGITPILSMITRLRATKRAWSLHYSCRTRSEALFIERLESDSSTKMHFDDETVGKAFDFAEALESISNDTHLYCCGPQGMLSSFLSATANWPREQIHYERFSSSEAAVAGKPFILELARSNKQLFVPKDKTILNVLREAGFDPPSSCEQGFCGSCAVPVIAGIPDHRDMVLTPEQRIANNITMICCSGCKTDKLVLDL